MVACLVPARRATQLAVLGIFLSGAAASFAAAEEPAAAEPPAAVAEPVPSATAPPPSASGISAVPRIVGSRLAADFRWSVNSLEADGEDILKSPCHVGGLLEDPSFYWTTLAAGAALGAGFALDEPARSQFRHISHQDASHLESWGNIALWGSTGALYLYGLSVDDVRAREYALTALASTGISGLLTGALKMTFGRERPDANQGHWQWFKGGSSFVSGATTPAFALAADISEYADNRWYVALPAYTAAASVGLGRMGKDAHWISDIVGSALLGVGTTELFLHMHALHAADPSRYRVFPVAVNHGFGVGVTVAF
jgi:membrane-associated phospholipid phosphatase